MNSKNNIKWAGYVEKVEPEENDLEWIGHTILWSTILLSIFLCFVIGILIFNLIFGR